MSNNNKNHGFIYRFFSRILLSIGKYGKKALDKIFTRRQRYGLHVILFKTETKAGRIFDTILIWVIICSVLIVVLETVTVFKDSFWWIFFVLEWIFTIVFTIEYILRLYSARDPIKYAWSFFGWVDLLALIPTYISVFFLGAQHLLIVRAMRLLRIFRIFKMGHFVSEGSLVVSALKASRTKIYVFVSFVALMAIILGSLMYMVEGHLNENYSNIPKGIYWAITTLTTVGYGDVVPFTPMGRLFATMVMILGYGVIAVPTGIVTAEISSRVMKMKEIMELDCANCGQREHQKSAIYCHRCSEDLHRFD
jgi:voltage-gated potassium channel